MYFGIDKTTVKNIEIKAIDLEHLEKLSQEQEVKFIRSRINFNGYVEYLQIIDEHFGILTSGYKINGGRFVPYLFISINKPRIGSNNLVPQSIEAFRSHYLTGLQSYIKKAYRIELDFGKVKFADMEINCTFALDEEYGHYQKVFEFMMTNAPKTYKLRSTIAEHGTDNATHYIKNKSIQCKIYNKQLQLEHLGNTYNMNDNVCRIEYTLKDSKKIEAVFGTCEVHHIEQQRLKEFFINQFEKDFVKPLDKAIKEQQKLIQSKLKSKKQTERCYITKTTIELMAKEQLFDVELLYSAISKVDKLNSKRTIKNFENNLDVESLKNNIRRLQELQSKIKDIHRIEFKGEQKLAPFFMSVMKGL